MKKNSSHKEYCVYCKNNYDFDIPHEILQAIYNAKLVIFAGAGVSTEKRTVYPNTFYEDIRQELSLDIKSNLSFSSLMSLYCKQPNGRSKLLLRIKDRLNYIQSFPELYQDASAFHKDLSTIHTIKDIITTNWDDYFERECGCTPVVNAEDFIFWDTPERKVYKIHGSINNFGSIIATEDDYKKCYKTLQNGLIGSCLKMLLATKVVVFIGLSFGDDDFNRTYTLLKKEMKDLIPHAYIVTIDPNIKQKIKDMNITPIITDATYFINKIKEHLINANFMLDDNRYDGIMAALVKVRNEHKKLISNFKWIEHPEILFASHYQDGLKHAFERILALKHTGHYSNPHNVMNTIDSYESIIKEKLKGKIYHDVAYVKGYIAGLIYFLSEDKTRKDLPFYYVFGYKNDITTLKEYKDICINAEKLHKSSYQYATKVLSKKGMHTLDIVVHHTPFL